MVETVEATQMTRATSLLLFPELELKITANGTYPSEDSLEVLAWIAFDNAFANTGAKVHQLARGDDVAVEVTARNPLAQALLYHLRGLDADAVDDQFDRVRGAILQEAAHNRVFTRPVDLLLTFTTGSIMATKTLHTSVPQIQSKEPTVRTSSQRSVLLIRTSGLRLDSSP